MGQVSHHAHVGFPDLSCSSDADSLCSLSVRVQCGTAAAFSSCRVVCAGFEHGQHNDSGLILTHFPRLMNMFSALLVVVARCNDVRINSGSFPKL